MRLEERMALEANRQIEEQERKVRTMRQVMLQALPTARDGGLSAQELADAWSVPRQLVSKTTDIIHRERKYTV